MKKILDEIIVHKKIEVEKQKDLLSIDSLMNQKYFSRLNLSLKNNICDASKTGIIAEFKRQSPSKGIINNKANIINTIEGYNKYNASGVSILTDTKYFGGKQEDITNVRHVEIPILRKDFIVDEYQLYESKAIGADCILLIATCLTKKDVFHLAKKAKELKLEVLLELHQEKDLDSINEYVDMVGINNRNLQTFEVDLEHSFKLLKKIPSEFIAVAESGIHSMQDLIKLKQAGFKGFLMGEKFMQNEKPEKAFQEFVEKF